MNSTDSDVEFNEIEFVDLIKQSSSYDELRILCDVKNTECIIARDEYAAMKDCFGNSYDDDIDLSVL